MKIGICTDAVHIAQLSEGVADYVELNLTSLKNMSEADFHRMELILSDKGIKAEATNCFFPGDVKLCGRRLDMVKVSVHTQRALERAAILGIHTCVLGSGAARMIEEGENVKSCSSQLIEVFGRVGDIAKEYGTTVVIEPLNKGETNTVNSVSEASKIVRKLKHDNIMLLADLFHVAMENEPLSVISDNGDILRHMHIARPEGRLFPKEGDGYDYTLVKEACDKAGYNLRISIEGRYEGDDFKKSAEESLEFLKKIFK
ncbi:MAG: sugar phosphate isomerase/epimerase [Clostridia bacterium]|nr:sugar phosphate isomerase/epimerase [Clostridia bacterium]